MTDILFLYEKVKNLEAGLSQLEQRHNALVQSLMQQVKQPDGTSDTGKNKSDASR